MGKYFTRREARRADWHSRQGAFGDLTRRTGKPSAPSNTTPQPREATPDYPEVRAAGGQIMFTQGGLTVARYKCVVCESAVWVAPPTVVVDPKCEFHQPTEGATQ